MSPVFLSLTSTYSTRMADLDLELSRTEPFPWHLGVFDAHCHPTDTLPSISNIAGMKTRALTIMATRAQDQSLVADFADKLAITDVIPAIESASGSDNAKGHIIPAFGWHPWFSHQIFVGEKDDLPNKFNHYRSAISPSPEDDDFIAVRLPQPILSLFKQIRSTKTMSRCSHAPFEKITLT